MVNADFWLLNAKCWHLAFMKLTSGLQNAWFIFENLFIETKNLWCSSSQNIWQYKCHRWVRLCMRIVKVALIICAGIQIQLLQPFVVCCCTLNKTRNCDEYLFDKLAQTQVVIDSTMECCSTKAKNTF